jgi:hypothetical protein
MLGVISSSSFFVPQVNLPGSMASFVWPAAIPILMTIPSAMATKRRKNYAAASRAWAGV